MKKIIFTLFMLTQLFFAQNQNLKQTFISLSSTGVQEFLDNYPEYDGRGTIILIIDSGVDVGIEGLTETTTGEAKVIDVRDFSGEGNTKFYEADIEEDDDTLFFVNEDMELKVAGVNDVALKPIDDEYFIGALDEKMWMNSYSNTSDLNGNGKINDKFVYVTFKVSENDWVLYIDTDSDGSLVNEVPLKNYKFNNDTFQIENELGVPNYTFGLNIFPESSEVIFHYDAVAHGTHCAGIAAGNRIGNNNFNGVAPGAYIGSLKIGNSRYGAISVTGSMKAAYDYADKLAREREEPVIVNMSYGIGSEIEGLAEIEEYLNNLVSANPYLYIAVSNGNEGPGISSAGLPSSSSSIFSSGATLAKELAADLYGADLPNDIILHFSSRGGEVNKPDVVAPGAATSTVPSWTDYDRFWGTSMASPYSAGVMSLLLSAMKVEYPDLKIPSRFLYKVLKESAIPMDGYTPVDQGSGLINVMKAYELLKKYIDAGEVEKFETYTISSTSPNTPSGNAENLYLRNGSFLTGNQTFSYTVRRDNFIAKDKFYRTYLLKCDSDWLDVITKRTYIRNFQSAKVNIKFDSDEMRAPGLYSARIKAYRNDGSNFPEFEMLANVVVPYKFTNENNYHTIFSGRLAPAEVKRIFIDIPAGANAMKVKLYRDQYEYSKTWYALHDPAGRSVSSSGTLDSGENEMEIQNIYYDLMPGAYELDVVGHYTANDTVTYNLDVEFISIENTDDQTVSVTDNHVNVINRFSHIERFNISASLNGYQKNYSVKIDKQPVYEMPFKLRSNEKEKLFEIILSKEDYNKLTDFEMQIVNSDGKVVSSASFNYREVDISLYNSYDKENLEFTLKFIPAFVDEPGELTLYITEDSSLKAPVSIDASNKGNSSIILYPSIMEMINLEFEEPDIKFPEDVKPTGVIKFENPETGKAEYELPIYFNLEKGVDE